MTTFEILSTILAGAAAVTSTIALFHSAQSHRLAKKANDIATNANKMADGANELAIKANDIATDANNMANGANDLAKKANDIATDANNMANGANELAIKANSLSEQANSLSHQAIATDVKMFKRHDVIDLHNAWQGVNAIDTSSPVGPDIIRAANALSLTATIWNHDIMEKEILMQSYWPAFKRLYDQLASIKSLVPGHYFTSSSLITPDIEKAYQQMKEQELSTIKQTTV